jgi:hypothetical protein
VEDMGIGHYFATPYFYHGDTETRR